MEEPPAELPVLRRELYRDAGGEQVVAALAPVLRDGPPVAGVAVHPQGVAVQFLQLLLDDDPGGALAGQEVLLTEVLEDFLREVQVPELLPDGLRLLGDGGVGLPVHGKASKKGVAAEGQDGGDSQQQEGQLAVRQADRGRVQDVAGVLHLPAQAEEPPEKDQVEEQREPDEPAGDGAAREEKHPEKDGVPETEGPRGGGLWGLPGLSPGGQESPPEAEGQGQQGQDIDGQDGRLQRRRGAEEGGLPQLFGPVQRQAQDGEAVAGPEPAVLPPEAAEADEAEEGAGDPHEEGQKGADVQRHAAEGQAPGDEPHSPAERGHLPDHVLGWKLRQGGAEEGVKILRRGLRGRSWSLADGGVPGLRGVELLAHGRSPPIRCRSRALIR